MSWWRSLLNLPPRGERWSDQRKARKHRRHEERPQDTDWWEQPGSPSSAARRRPGGGTATATRPSARRASVAPPGPYAPPGEPPPRIREEVPWSTESESSFGTWGRRFLRGLVVVVLLLAAASGIRSWIRPGTSDTPAASSESSYPRLEAQAVAARFATSYLTWDEADRDARTAAIGLDVAAALDKNAGWNGQGKQSAGTAYPGEVRVGPEGVTAQVDVRVLVTSYAKQGSQWHAGKPGWQRLSVPVARTATRVVVTGSPTYVSDSPAPLPDDMPGTGAPDEELTNRTSQDAEAFFKAYGSTNEAVAAVTAPGSVITSLNGVVEFNALKSWQVYAGNDDERRATAAVTWDGAGKTTLDQNYTVTLRRTVAANGVERWQVAAIG